MDVYLIPVGSLGDNRYELYCERVVDEETLNPDAPAGAGRWAVMRHRFAAAVARVEHHQRSGATESVDGHEGWGGRMQRLMVRAIAEKVVEQRLLWRLRKEAAVTLFFPDEMTGAQALGVARAILKRDRGRHLKWTVLDGVLFCASGLVALVPGPNVLAYYLGFRMVGHYLSWRGAKHGLDEAQWECEACPHGRMIFFRPS